MELLARLAREARARPFPPREPQPRAPSLKGALERPGIVAELKPASPLAGPLRAIPDPESLARSLLDAGAAGVSALAEPDHFGGSGDLVAAASRAGGPVLWKDFVVTRAQLDAARDAGASAVLLILPLLEPGHAEWRLPEDAIEAAHERGLEVLLEVYDDEEYLLAGLLEADMVGINNRDLRDPRLPVDADRALEVLGRCGILDVPVLALSGASGPAQVRAQVQAGARGVLVGTSLMRAPDPAAKLRELKEGLL